MRQRSPLNRHGGEMSDHSRWVVDPPITASSLWWPTPNGRIAAASRVYPDANPFWRCFPEGIKQGFYVLAADDMIAYGAGPKDRKKTKHSNERGLLNPAISWPRGCVDEAGEGDRRPWRRRMATVPWSSVFRVSLLVILLAAIVIAFVTLPIEKVTLYASWSCILINLRHRLCAVVAF
ncbi:hypothetical protein B296_00045869 [Ensete ventricosum]|uniref:Uncharacterized protein n=1 Tax=Ensete ventricosum TaxID=4639 RepID=A0A426Z5Z3_ENSVE|nr:hypothetical protein B296_00045869 [Ensete ventricosum]